MVQGEELGQHAVMRSESYSARGRGASPVHGSTRTASTAPTGIRISESVRRAPSALLIPMLLTSRPELRPLVHARDLIINLVSRDFRARYQDSLLGVLWAVANPLAQLVIYDFIFQRVLDLGINRYSSFAFIGLIAWGWVSSSANESARVLKANRYMIDQPGFPAPILPIVSVATNMMDFIIGVPLVLLITALEGAPLHATILLVPVVAVIEFAFILGFSFLLAGLNAAFRDVQHVVGIVLQLYLFVTPIFYSLDKVPEAYMPLFQINPMTHIVEAYRDLIMRGTGPDWGALGYVAIASAVLITLGVGVYNWARYRFLEDL